MSAERTSANDYTFQVLRNHFEHFLKLLDLFETRQTWAFNFTVIVYVSAIAAVGPLLEHLVPTKMHSGIEILISMCAGVVVYSIVVPILILPLCFLYSDVSVYCAALNEGNINFLHEAYKRLSVQVQGSTDPGALAFNWLNDPGRDARERLDIDRVANCRVMLFFVAPLFGMLLSGAVTIGFLSRYGVPVPLLGVSISGLVISMIALLVTYLTCRKTWKARTLARVTQVKRSTKNG